MTPVDRMPGRLLGTLALHLTVGAGGAVVAVLAAWVSRATWRAGGAAVPWGLALALAGSVGAVWVARALTPSAGFAVAAGWIIGVAYLLPGGPGGDFVLANDGYGNTFVLLGAVAVIVAALSGSRRR